MYGLTEREIKSVCFTGHRSLTDAEQSLLTLRLQILLRQLIIQHGTVNFYAGGALGFDTLAAKTVLSLKNEFPDIKLNLILPCESQDKNWTEKQRFIYRAIKSRADSVRILSPYYYNGCMQVRNHELLAASDLCIAYLRNGTSEGGTLSTVLQAARMNIATINLAKPDMEVL